jgi:HEAT repeat protein/predicted MPP superfamily phosphohydrolase
MKTDFYITYHHSDEMAARWIAAELKQAQFSTLSDSWDFLPGQAPLEKIEHMFTVSRNAMVLISDNFLQSQVLNKRFFGVQGAIFLTGGAACPPLVAEGIVFLVRIYACEIEKVLGTKAYLDLADIKEAEAVKRLLGAVGAARADKKETEPLPVSVKTWEETLAKRKQELDQLLLSTIKHNYHMKLDLEQEVEKVVEVKNEKTGEMEKRKEWVWEPVPLEIVLKDGKNYILVNPSGMGKTTFLTYVACTMLDRDADYPFLPLFFTCIGLNTRADTIENFILHQVESFYTHSQGSLMYPEWDNLFVLLDALDQARDVDDIVSSLQLHNKPLNYKKAKIILSSRQNTADKVKEGFEKIRLKLPDASEVQHYLGEENYKKLEGLIASSGELVKAPVLLEMLKTITEKGHVVSTLYNRSGLYTEFTKILLDQERSKPRFWQDTLSIRHFIDYELEQALEKIAFFSLADNEILEIPKEKLVHYCESAAKKEALLNIGIMLEFFEDREQKIVFRHQSFQAYFAARYMYYRQPQLFQELVGDIAFFYNDVWYEVMRFFVGMEKDPQKVETIIEMIIKKDKGVNVLNKITQWVKRPFKKYDLTGGLRLIFAVFLMSEAQVSCEFVQRVYEQLRDLLTNNNQYLDFFISNTDKFNRANDEQRRFIFVIFKPLIRDNFKYIKSSAAKALENIVTAKDIPFLEPLLRDKDSDVRRAAVEALGNIGTSEYIPLLEPLLRDEEGAVRSTAAKALGNIIKTKDIPLLESLLWDENRYVRCAAIEALGKIGTTKDIPILDPLLKDKTACVRSAAANALCKIFKPKDIRLLEPMLKNEDRDIRRAAVEAMGNNGKAQDIHLLYPLLNDEDYDVRRAAVEALGNIGTAKDIPLLEPLLRDEDSYISGTAAEALWKIVRAGDIPLLEPLLKAKNIGVRVAAFEALWNIVTSKDISFLELLLRDKSVFARRAAAAALWKIGTAEHILLLGPLLRDNAIWVRTVATEALGKIGTAQDIPLLKPLLRDEYEAVRRCAAEALGKIGTSKHIPLLEPLLMDKGLKDFYGRSPTFEAIEKIYKRSTPVLCIDMILPGKKERKAISVKPFSAQTLNILHISDIHYAIEKDPTITCIFHEFLQDIKKWRAQQNNNKIHSICLTGDIAQSGQENQYHSINKKIKDILTTIGCPPENLFIIPGNHDVQEYDKISLQGKTLLEQVRDNQMNIDTGVLSSFENYRQFHDKFANFYRFIENSGYLNSLPENLNDLPKPWYNRKLKDFPVRIMGLNSALFCLKDFCQYGNLRMGTHQFHEAYFQGKVGDRRDQELVILLTHHPLNWLIETEYEDYSTLMERYAVIHLHGHIHKTHIYKKQRLFSSSGGYVSIGTGSLYGEKGKEDINTYHIITFDFENQELNVWARRWNPDSGKWTVYDPDENKRFLLPHLKND